MLPTDCFVPVQGRLPGSTRTLLHDVALFKPFFCPSLFLQCTTTFKLIYKLQKMSFTSRLPSNASLRMVKNVLVTGKLWLWPQKTGQIHPHFFSLGIDPCGRLQCHYE